MADNEESVELASATDGTDDTPSNKVLAEKIRQLELEIKRIKNQL